MLQQINQSSLHNSIVSSYYPSIILAERKHDQRVSIVLPHQSYFPPPYPIDYFPPKPLR